MSVRDPPAYPPQTLFFSFRKKVPPGILRLLNPGSIAKIPPRTRYAMGNYKGKGHVALLYPDSVTAYADPEERIFLGQGSHPKLLHLLAEPFIHLGDLAGLWPSVAKASSVPLPLSHKEWHIATLKKLESTE